MSKSTEQSLKRIQDKLQTLLKQHAVLARENERLEKELGESQGRLKAQLSHADDLKQQVNIMKAGTGEMTAGDKKEFEKRINTYLKEIDKIIAMLGE